ncbi:uncharacterized protein LOC112526964 isoform X1 [Cynara cardunculus var. scolymus]|uniref:uncharacterized protein LOC112526964 isoform X1 n=1 Tax=Cynara cardunculus var. scolymus TaxID=59895 RepID=UPI000D62D143|nr:uncharacterized protein LOC112526964 isoform X1 [Cynara cardunculus var. scolymus]
MEDQAQKMEALKKAYAEIILNTAKEAANRAMVSECKALRFHHDLHNTKDEALRMLLRFKHIIDAKTTEAEMTTLGQQKRIEELDAQLNETEGVIVDLREELRKAHERFEEVKKSHMLQSNEPFGNEHMHDIEDTAHDKKIDVTEQFRSSSQCGRCSNSANKTATSGPHLDNFFIGNPNLASVNTGSKEPDFCRNGYTHRIRAIERNLVDGQNISEDRPAQELCTKKQLIINVDEKSSGKCAPSSIDAESKDMNIDPKNINGSEALFINSSVAKDQSVKAQRLPRNRVRYAQSSPKLSRFDCRVIKPTAVPENLNLKENSLGRDEKLLETNEQSACTLRRSIRKRKVRCLDEISSLFKSRTALSRCKKNSGSAGLKLDEHQYRYKSVAEMNQMIAPISPSTNASEETKDDELPGPLHIYPVENTGLLNELVVEKNEVAAKESAEHTGGSAFDNDKNRLLKYTFSRKRKKNLSSKSDNCSNTGKSILSRKMGERSSFSPEQEKTSLIEDPSADSQNMVEVACQLISLSEERSW